MSQITREMVEERHRAIAAEIGEGERYKGTSTANGVMRTFRAMWNFAAESAPDLPPNPVRLRRQWFSEPRRERLVSVDELPRFYEAVCGLSSQISRDYILMMLHTGLRRGEAGGLRWEHVDFNARVIRLPASSTKAGRRLDLPMSDFVRDLLVARRAIGNAGYVFPAAGGRHVSAPSYPLRQIFETTGIRVSAHDLRRTFLTVAESAGLSVTKMKAIANHSLGGDVTFGYVVITVERLRPAVQKACDHMMALCATAAPAGANVVNLKI